jgi:hypothetical protein
VPSARQRRWQQPQVTGFLHVGLNAFVNKKWGDSTALPALFNLVAPAASQWGQAAVVTSK